MKTLLFRAVVEPDDERWMAYCPALVERGAASWGHSSEEALQNLHDIVRMTVASMRAHNELIPEEPDQNVRVPAELQIAVAV